MLTRAQKETEVAELHERFQRASSVFVAEYRGLSVAAVDALRSRLRTAGGTDFEYRVAKNTLVRRAAAGAIGDALAPHLEGPTALAFSFGDPTRLAKVLVDYAKDNEVFKVRGGFMDGQPLGAEEVATLATLPSLDELRGKLIGLVLAPATKIAGVLAAPAGQLARLMTARQEKLEEAGGAS
ncbi:50S ribosomal protein L10 [Myxococcota bacterium]|nr:50S ribosomal protein L10 [Myxococcota bacterium]MCZ7619530.1 50S ribosomal protein L10 [Myxococcota bacterium]